MSQYQPPPLPLKPVKNLFYSAENFSYLSTNNLSYPGGLYEPSSSVMLNNSMVKVESNLAGCGRGQTSASSFSGTPGWCCSRVRQECRTQSCDLCPCARSRRCGSFVRWKNILLLLFLLYLGSIVFSLSSAGLDKATDNINLSFC